MKQNCPGENRFGTWLTDSGATSCMTPYRKDLFDFDDTIVSINVTIADDKKVRVLGKGTVKLTRMDGKHIRMLDVMYVPGLDRLLSVRKLAERVLRVEFQQFPCVI